MSVRMLLSLALLLTLPACAQKPRSSGGGKTRVPAVGACVDQTFDSNGYVNLSNHCTYNIVLRVFFGSDTSNVSTLTLGSDGSLFPTGWSSDDIEHRGPIQIYACPADHPDVRDLNGEKIFAPEKSYLCE